MVGQQQQSKSKVLFCQKVLTNAAAGSILKVFTFFAVFKNTTFFCFFSHLKDFSISRMTSRSEARELRDGLEGRERRN